MQRLLDICLSFTALIVLAPFLLPVIIIGLLEDITLSVAIIFRLLSILLSSFLLIFNTDVYLQNVEVFYIDYLLNINLAAMIITVLGISIAGNSFNFIDGLNGLTSGLSTVYLILFYHLCLSVNDVDFAKKKDQKANQYRRLRRLALLDLQKH